MDETRRIRFLVPPVLFAASLLWGAWFDQGDAWRRLSTAIAGSDGEVAIKIIADGGIVIFAAGYVFGTVTYFCLRLYGSFSPLPGNSRFHEAFFANETLLSIWEYLGQTPNMAEVPDKALYGVIAFDHGFLRHEFPGVHEWLVRRWSAFAIAAVSITAILSSFVFGGVLNIEPSWNWYAPWGGFLVMLFFVALWAQHDGENVIKFISEKKLRAPKTKANSEP